jgi:hypothetical protein
MKAALSKLDSLGEDWKIAAKLKAPTGPTGSLQRGITVGKSKSKKGIALYSSTVDYALVQMLGKLMHVPKGIVGQKGFQDFGKSLPQTKRMKSTTRRRLYQRGYRWASRIGFPSYVHNFAIVAWNLIEGDKKMRGKR